MYIFKIPKSQTKLLNRSAQFRERVYVSLRVVSWDLTRHLRTTTNDLCFSIWSALPFSSLSSFSLSNPLSSQVFPFFLSFFLWNLLPFTLTPKFPFFLIRNCNVLLQVIRINQISTEKKFGFCQNFSPVFSNAWLALISSHISR